MRACYINLDGALERRRQVEAAFARVPADGWELHRFAAIAPPQVAELSGRLRPAEKACFESHRQLIGQHLDDEAPLLVLEDDVVFSQRVFPVLNAMLQGPDEWDLLFTDVAFFHPARIVEAVQASERLAKGREIAAARLAGGSFVGANAYLIRGTAKPMLHRLLRAAAVLDTPYDVYLSQCVARGELRASVCLPFLTTLSEHADQSQIQLDAPIAHRALDLGRRLMFVERDLVACSDAAKVLDARLSEPERILGTVVGALSLP